MIGRKSTKSMLTRLEALEKRSPNSLTIFLEIEETERRLTIKEYLKLPAEVRESADFSQFHISGNNLKEFDILLGAILGDDAVI